MQGVRPFDLVQVCLSLGLTNGGLLAREGIWKYTRRRPCHDRIGRANAYPPPDRALKAWKCKFLVGFPAYFRHMATRSAG